MGGGGGGGRGNGEKQIRGWQGLKAGRGVESRRWGGWTGRMGDGEGWMAMARERQEGGIWKRATGGGDGEGSSRDGKRVAMGRRTM